MLKTKTINEKKLKKRLAKYARNLVKIDSNTYLFADLMIDSLSLIALLTDLETDYDIYISEGELFAEEDISYSQLINFLYTKLDLKE